MWGDAIDFTETTNAKLPYMLHGTGDVFASTLLAAVMAGSNLAEATAFAADFTAELAELDPSAEYVVYCQSGNRSSRAVAQMEQGGFTSVHDAGGISDAAAATGLTVVG